MVYRITPALGPNSYKTYQISQPKATHFRKATCEEVECQAQAHGWRTVVPADSEQAFYIRKVSGRKFTEHRDESNLLVFTFEAGQTCFGEHMVSTERPALFVIKDGDYRIPGAGRQVRDDQWVDDFAEHQARLAEHIERG